MLNIIDSYIGPHSRMYVYSRINARTTDINDLDADQGRAMAFESQHGAPSGQVPADGLVLETGG